MKKYSGKGSLQKFNGDAATISYEVEIELMHNGKSIKEFTGKVTGKPLDASFVGQELDLLLEGGRAIGAVTVLSDGKITYSNGQVIGFDDLS